MHAPCSCYTVDHVDRVLFTIVPKEQHDDERTEQQLGMIPQRVPCTEPEGTGEMRETNDIERASFIAKGHGWVLRGLLSRYMAREWTH